MEYLSELFPVILDFLLIILVVILIVLAVRLLETLKKVDKVVDDVNVKVNKLNGLFDVIDTATDTISIMSNRIVNVVATSIDRFFTKNKKKKEDEENE